MSAPRNTPWTEEAKARAKAMWLQGKSYSDISRMMGISRSAIAGRAGRDHKTFPPRTGSTKKVTYPVAPPKQWTWEEIQTVAKLWNEGSLIIQNIAQLVDSTVRAVRYLAQSNPDLFVKKVQGGKGKSKGRKVVSNDWNRPVRDASEPAVVYQPPGLDDYETARLPLAPTMAENTGCKYPLNEGGPFVFCGCERYELKPYCRYHVIKCRGVGTKSERSAGKFDRKVA